MSRYRDQHPSQAPAAERRDGGGYRPTHIIGIDVNRSGSSSRWRGIPLLRLLTFIILGVQFLLIFRPDEYFRSRPFQEDAFYALSVARSLAAGKGISIDGVHPTNGVQPLICFLDAPLFAVAGGDQFLALRLALLLQIILLCAATFAVAWFAATLLRRPEEKPRVFWLVAMLIAWSYPFINGMMNGLETGLAITMGFTAASYYNARIVTDPDAGLGRHALLGLLLGVAVLARIDLSFLVPAILLCHLVRAHLRYAALPWSERLGRLRRVLLECATIGVISVAVSSPWWIYNLTMFGSLVPISGQSQKMLITDRPLNVATAFYVLADALAITVNTPRSLAEISPLLGALGFLVVMAIIFAVGRGFPLLGRALRSWGEWWDPSRIAPLGLFALGITLYYAFFFGAPHFLIRYLMPARILISLAVVTLLYIVWNLAPARSPLRGLLMLVLAGTMAVSIYGYSWNFTNYLGNTFSSPAVWIAESLPPTATVGMFQSGTTAFFNSNVVNLDGKVNADALRALQQGRISRYVDSMEFDYLIDWDYYLRQALADSATRAHYRPVDTVVGTFIVMKRTE